MNEDVKILRELAGEVSEISKASIQNERRLLWKEHNSLKRTRPMVYAQIGMWDFVGTEVVTKDVIKCKDPDLRDIEIKLRCMIFKDYVGDDDIIEPWVSVDPVFTTYGWGIENEYVRPEQEGGAYKITPPLKDIEDINQLLMPKHLIDEEKTLERVLKVEDAIGDILTVNRERGNAYLKWQGDLAYLLGHLVGMEEMMYYFYDRPEWMHNILGFLRDGILKIYDEAEKSGDWRLTTQHNQAMTYSEELPDPKANSERVTRDNLWIFNASQEFALISPEMTEEFLLQYQLPILERFGLSAYGCCEDLTRKIDILKQIPNLRRISVSPWADVAECARQIEDRYVLSWRPSPSATICNAWDPNYIREYTNEAMEKSNGCIVDITLKDVQTVKGEIWRIKEWFKIVRDVTAQYV